MVLRVLPSTCSRGYHGLRAFHLAPVCCSRSGRIEAAPSPQMQQQKPAVAVPRRPPTVDFTTKKAFNPFGRSPKFYPPAKVEGIDTDEAVNDADDGELGEGGELASPATMVARLPMGDPRTLLFDMYIPPFLQGKKTRQLFGSNIHVREDARGKVLVKKVEFLKSSSKESECPQDGFPEFAVIGRSNVGKSSLINLLVERKKIALVSKKPGKTQLINHFLVNKLWYLVDLPGYGYAKAPKHVCLNWNQFTKEYFRRRKTLVMVVLLIDSTIEPTQIDLDCATWLGRNNVPMTLAFTKCDRRIKGRRRIVENVISFLQNLKATYPHTPPWILTSCVTGQGRDELMVHLSELRKYWHS